MSDIQGTTETKKDDYMTPGPQTWFEKFGAFISKIRTKEVQFDKAYAKEIKCDNCKNIRQYQGLVFGIKIIEALRTAFVVWQVGIIYLKSKGL